MADLLLNDQTAHFKEFYGRNDEQMPELVAEGRTPISVSGVAERKLEVVAGNSDGLKSAWMDNYFDTGDGAFYHPEGNFKVVLGAQLIRDLTPESKLSRGALVLDEDVDASIAVYDALEGAEFTRNEVKGLTGRTLTKQEAKDHPVWQALIPDKTVREGYIEMTFDQGKERFGYDNMMGIWLAEPQEKATGRLWYVNYLIDSSNAYGNSNISGNYGRLVGVSNGVASAEGANAQGTRIVTPTLEQTLAIVNNPDLDRPGMVGALSDLYKQ